MMTATRDESAMPASGVPREGYNVAQVRLRYRLRWIWQVIQEIIQHVWGRAFRPSAHLRRGFIASLRVVLMGPLLGDFEREGQERADTLG
jgi:hypothetical protein